MQRSDCLCFFSHVISFAEINDAKARIRNDVYEHFFEKTITLARGLELGVSEEELERRVLEVTVVLEGLHAVSAFRPELVERNYEFKQRQLRRVNATKHGE